MGLMLRRAAIAVAYSLVGAPGTAETLEYTTLTTGRPSGTMVVDVTGPRRSVAFKFNDRGRGPDLSEVFRVDGAGIVESLRTRGVDYLKAPVNEHFSRGTAGARWNSQADAGTTQVKGFYLTYQQTPEDNAALVRALLKSPANSIGLLPLGQAHLRRVATRVVTSPPSIPQTVTLYAIDGAGLGPTLLWLDARNELFFSGNEWGGTVRRGWEAAVPPLVEAQSRALFSAEREAAKTLGHKPNGVWAIRHARLFDPRTKTTRGGMTVVISGNRIKAVGDDAGLAPPDGAEVIDATGKTLLPGLWDMHVHISDDYEGLLHLAAGVTSVRDMANDIERLAERKNSFDSGELPGPRIFRAGIIEGAGPLAGPTKVLVSNPEEVRAAVNRYADLGYEQIKIYSALNPALVPTAIEAAHRRGLRISGHIPAGMTAAQAVDEGLDEIQHINFVVLNFYPDVAGETAGMRRFTAVGERAGQLDLQSAEVRTFIAKLKARDIVIDPTVATFESMFTAEPHRADPSLAPVIDRLPPSVARAAFGGGLAKDADQHNLFRISYAKMVALLGQLHRAGIRMVPGTDGFAGFLFHRELELWSKAGIPNVDILYAATLGAASVNHHENDLGTIEPGKLADLVLFNGDPTTRISDVRRAALVVKNGTIFDPGRLYRAVNVRP